MVLWNTNTECPWIPAGGAWSPAAIGRFHLYDAEMLANNLLFSGLNKQTGKHGKVNKGDQQFWFSVTHQKPSFIRCKILKGRNKDTYSDSFGSLIAGLPYLFLKDSTLSHSFLARSSVYFVYSIVISQWKNCMTLFRKARAFVRLSVVPLGSSTSRQLSGWPLVVVLKPTLNCFSDAL